MGDLLIRNISPALKADIERLAARQGTTVTETVHGVLRRGLAELAHETPDKEPAGQRLTQILGNAFETDDEFQEFQTILEIVRRGESRPLPEFE